MTLSYTYFASKNGQPVTAAVATHGGFGHEARISDRGRVTTRSASD